ncbi:MAG: CorA family divalent cation transporter [Bilophila wadsworthia]
MKQHAITLAHGTYTELKDTEGAKGTEDKLLWLDIQGTSEELTHFLKERQIPPFLRRRVLSSQRFPSVFSGNDYVLLSVPARKTWVQKRSVSITFILFAQEVITLCRDEGYNFDGERKQLAEGDTASIRSASDLLIALLDSLVKRISATSSKPAPRPRTFHCMWTTPRAKSPTDHPRHPPPDQPPRQPVRGFLLWPCRSARARPTPCSPRPCAKSSGTSGTHRTTSPRMRSGW